MNFLSIACRAGFIAGLALAIAAPARAQAPRLSEAVLAAISISFETREGRCGGTLVGADLVLTAAHCIQPAGKLRPIDPSRIDIVLLDRGEASAPFKVVDIATAPGFRHDGQPEADSVARDIALLRLDRPAGLKPEQMAISHDIWLAMLPVDPESPMAAEPCEALHEGAGVMSLSCARPKGSSGSPVFASTPDGRRVVGVVSAAGQRADGTQVTFAVSPLDVLADLVWLLRDRGQMDSF